jgi:hypothetical protein
VRKEDSAALFDEIIFGSCKAVFLAHAPRESKGKVLPVAKASPEHPAVSWLPGSGQDGSCPNEMTFTVDCDAGEHFENGVCVPGAALQKQLEAEAKRESKEDKRWRKAKETLAAVLPPKGYQPTNSKDGYYQPFHDNSVTFDGSGYSKNEIHVGGDLKSNRSAAEALLAIVLQSLAPREAQVISAWITTKAAQLTADNEYKDWTTKDFVSLRVGVHRDGRAAFQSFFQPLPKMSKTTGEDPGDLLGFEALDDLLPKMSKPAGEDPVDPKDLVHRGGQAKDPGEARALLAAAHRLGRDVSADLRKLGPAFAQRSRGNLQRALRDAASDTSGSSTAADLSDAEADARQAAALGVDVSALSAQIVDAKRQELRQNEAWKVAVLVVEADLRAQGFAGGATPCGDCPYGTLPDQDTFYPRGAEGHWEDNVMITLHLGGSNGGREVEVKGLFQTEAQREAVRKALTIVLHALAPDGREAAVQWFLRTATSCPIEDGETPPGCGVGSSQSKILGRIRAQVSAEEEAYDSGHRIRGFRALLSPVGATP